MKHVCIGPSAPPCVRTDDGYQVCLSYLCGIYISIDTTGHVQCTIQKSDMVNSIPNTDVLKFLGCHVLQCTLASFVLAL